MRVSVLQIAAVGHIFSFLTPSHRVDISGVKYIPICRIMAESSSKMCPINFFAKPPINHLVPIYE